MSKRSRSRKKNHSTRRPSKDAGEQSAAVLKADSRKDAPHIPPFSRPLTSLFGLLGTTLGLIAACLAIRDYCVPAATVELTFQYVDPSSGRGRLSYKLINTGHIRLHKLETACTSWDPKDNFSAVLPSTKPLEWDLDPGEATTVDDCWYKLPQDMSEFMMLRTALSVEADYRIGPFWMRKRVISRAWLQPYLKGNQFAEFEIFPVHGEWMQHLFERQETYLREHMDWDGRSVTWRP